MRYVWNQLTFTQQLDNQYKRRATIPEAPYGDFYHGGTIRVTESADDISFSFENNATVAKNGQITDGTDTYYEASEAHNVVISEGEYFQIMSFGDIDDIGSTSFSYYVPAPAVYYCTDTFNARFDLLGEFLTNISNYDDGYYLTAMKRIKGTAAGTVSNTSSGAYQLDTSVDSLL